LTKLAETSQSENILEQKCLEFRTDECLFSIRVQKTIMQDQLIVHMQQYSSSSESEVHHLVLNVDEFALDDPQLAPPDEVLMQISEWTVPIDLLIGRVEARLLFHALPCCRPSNFVAHPLDLPHPVLLNVIGFLDVKSLKSLAFVNKASTEPCREFNRANPALDRRIVHLQASTALDDDFESWRRSYTRRDSAADFGDSSPYLGNRQSRFPHFPHFNDGFPQVNDGLSGFFFPQQPYFGPVSFIEHDHFFGSHPSTRRYPGVNDLKAPLFP
jgi:hypothetical protein